MHRTPLPSPITQASALAQLRNHDFLIRLDPELVEYTEEHPADPSPNTRYYSITDHMVGVPKAICDASISFKAEMTDVEDGVKWLVRAPLGLVQQSHWRLTEEGEGLVLIEDVHLACSRLLMGTVRGKCEENWVKIHGNFRAKLLETDGGNQEGIDNSAS